MNLVGIETNNYAFHYGGKIIIKAKNIGRIQICYVIDETNISITVQTRGNQEMRIYKPKYDRTIKPVAYRLCDESSGY